MADHLMTIHLWWCTNDRALAALLAQEQGQPADPNSQDQLRDTIWIAKWHRQLPEPLKAMIDVQAERIVVVHNRES